MVHHLDGVIANATQQIDYLRGQIDESGSAIETLEVAEEEIRTQISRHRRVIADLTHSLSVQQDRLARAQADKAESEA